jgi:hypothetical protein
MKYSLFTRVALAEDLPAHGLVKGDIGTIVEQYQSDMGQEAGYEVEIFDALGNAIDLVTVRESQIEPLKANTVLSMREIHEPAL